MSQDQKVRFIRKGGRIIPIRSKEGAAPPPTKKPKTKTKPYKQGEAPKSKSDFKSFGTESARDLGWSETSSMADSLKGGKKAAFVKGAAREYGAAVQRHKKDHKIGRGVALGSTALYVLKKSARPFAALGVVAGLLTMAGAKYGAKNSARSLKEIKGKLKKKK